MQWLWQVVGELGEDERKLFLKFFTGSDRAPIGGLANLRCVIQRDGPDSNRCGALFWPLLLVGGGFLVGVLLLLLPAGMQLSAWGPQAAWKESALKGARQEHGS